MSALLATFDGVALAKTAAVILVTLTFIAIVIRVMGAGDPEMDSYAALPLDDLPSQEN